jgi:hypothetical protein
VHLLAERVVEVIRLGRGVEPHRDQPPEGVVSIAPVPGDRQAAQLARGVARIVIAVAAGAKERIGDGGEPVRAGRLGVAVDRGAAAQGRQAARGPVADRLRAVGTLLCQANTLIVQ